MNVALAIFLFGFVAGCIVFGAALCWWDFYHSRHLREQERESLR